MQPNFQSEAYSSVSGPFSLNDMPYHLFPSQCETALSEEYYSMMMVANNSSLTGPSIYSNHAICNGRNNSKENISSTTSHPCNDRRLYHLTFFNDSSCLCGRSNTDYYHIHPQEVVITSKDLFFTNIGQDNYLYHSQEYALRVCSRDVMDEDMQVRVDLINMNTNQPAKNESKMILKGLLTKRLSSSKVCISLSRV